MTSFVFALVTGQTASARSYRDAFIARAQSQGVSTETLEYYQKIPEWMFSPTPPSIEELELLNMGAEAKKLDVELEAMRGVRNELRWQADSFFDPRTADFMLRLRESLPVKSQLVFVGNGGYPLHVLNEGLLGSQRSSDKSVFLPLSRAFFDSQNYDRQAFYDYLDQTKLGESSSPIVFVDTVHTPNPEREHSLLKLTSEFQRYLHERKGMSIEESRLRAIPFGIIENVDGIEREYHKVTDIEAYQRVVRSFLSTNEAKIPFVDSGFDWKGGGEGAYHFRPRWNDLDFRASNPEQVKFSLIDPTTRAPATRINFFEHANGEIISDLSFVKAKVQSRFRSARTHLLALRWGKKLSLSDKYSARIKAIMCRQILEHLSVEK
jgi:hypothetical protein